MYRVTHAVTTMLALVTIISCNRSERFAYRTFPLNPLAMSEVIDSLYRQNSQYQVPSKWKIYNSYSQRGSVLKSQATFYFPPPDDEMYQVAIIPNNEKTKLIVTAVHGLSGWRLESDLDDHKILSVQKKFDERIIRKLEIISQQKCLHEQ